MRSRSLGDVAPPTILIVEDARALAESTAKMLRKAGFRVVVAVGATQALRIALHERGRISLVIADVHVPVLGGRELVASLRKNGVDAPALYVSGTSLGDIPEYRNEAFLAKPWSFDELIEAVETALAA